MTSINIDSDIRRGRLRSLLYLLSLGRLDKENAGDLKGLLMQELATTINDKELHNELSALIKILNRYINGEVDLMIHPELILSSI